MEDVFKTLNLSDDNDIFGRYAAMIELYNALKFLTMLFFIQKILTFNLGDAFIKSVSIHKYTKFEPNIPCGSRVMSIFNKKAPYAK